MRTLRWTILAAARASRSKRAFWSGSAAVCGQHDLEGDVAVEEGVVGLVDDAHGAAAEDADDVVFADVRGSGAAAPGRSFSVKPASSIGGARASRAFIVVGRRPGVNYRARRRGCQGAIPSAHGLGPRRARRRRAPKIIPPAMVIQIQTESWGRSAVQKKSPQRPHRREVGPRLGVVGVPAAEDREEHDDEHGDPRGEAVGEQDAARARASPGARPRMRDPGRDREDRELADRALHDREGARTRDGVQDKGEEAEAQRPFPADGGRSPARRQAPARSRSRTPGSATRCRPARPCRRPRG